MLTEVVLAPWTYAPFHFVNMHCIARSLPYHGVTYPLVMVLWATCAPRICSHSALPPAHSGAASLRAQAISV